MRVKDQGNVGISLEKCRRCLERHRALSGLMAVQYRLGRSKGIRFGTAMATGKIGADTEQGLVSDMPATQREVRGVHKHLRSAFELREHIELGAVPSSLLRHILIMSLRCFLSP